VKPQEFFKQTQRGKSPVVERMPPPAESVVEEGYPTGSASADLMDLLNDGQRIVSDPVETMTRKKNPRGWPKGRPS